MKIMKIEPHGSYGICDDLLQNGFYSDALFDRYFIDITINVMYDSTEGIFYRKLWEDTYIKTMNSPTHINKDSFDELVVSITLSEAIGFIYKATPPRFVPTIKDSHKDVETIINTLKSFLIEESGRVTYDKLFFEHIHLKPFETKQENFTKLKAGADLIKSKLPNGSAHGFYIYASTHSIEALSEGKDMAGMGASRTMICVKVDDNKIEMIDLFKKLTLDIDESVYVKIDNVQHANDAYYISFMITVDPSLGGFDYMPTPYAKIIKQSYENIK